MKTLVAIGNLAVTVVLAQPYSIDWHSIANGGGTSAGGDFIVIGSIEQPDVSKMSGGDYTLAGGFSAFLEAAGITTIFDNVAGVNNGGFGASSNNWLAGRFCLGSQSYQLDSVSLLLNSQDAGGQPGPPSTVRLQIYSADPVSGKPFAVTGPIMNLAGLTNPITPQPRGFGLVKWVPATPFRLANNTCYWTVFSRDSGGNIGQIASVTRPTGDAAALGGTQSANAGATWGAIDTGVNFIMLIQGIVSGTPQELAISAPKISANTLSFNFTGLSNRTYVIESRTNVAAGAWTEVPETTRVGNGVSIELTLSNAFNQRQEYFRVKQLP